MNDLPVRQQNRLKGYDYANPGVYYITICSKNRECLFWETADNLTKPEEVVLTEIGRCVGECIHKIESIYDFVMVDAYCIMYDHIHLLLTINEGANTSVEKVMNQLKRVVSMESGRSVWQKSYYDHIIRDENDYKQKYTYIENNPLNFILRNEW